MFVFQNSDKVIFITATEDDDGKPEIDYHLARSSGSNNNSMIQVSLKKLVKEEFFFQKFRIGGQGGQLFLILITS